jgi:hypothetical protein
LQQIDLEYRAKLAELNQAQETVYDILDRFIHNRTETPDNPHAFPNHCILRDLSKIVFEGSMVTDIEQWKKIPTDTINATAVKLLKAHTVNLNEVGSKDVVQFLQ